MDEWHLIVLLQRASISALVLAAGFRMVRTRRRGSAIQLAGATLLLIEVIAVWLLFDAPHAYLKPFSQKGIRLDLRIAGYGQFTGIAIFVFGYVLESIEITTGRKTRLGAESD